MRQWLKGEKRDLDSKAWKVKCRYGNGDKRPAHPSVLFSSISPRWVRQPNFFLLKPGRRVSGDFSACLCVSVSIWKWKHSGSIYVYVAASQRCAGTRGEPAGSGRGVSAGHLGIPRRHCVGKLCSPPRLPLADGFCFVGKHRLYSVSPVRRRLSDFFWQNLRASPHTTRGSRPGHGP